MNATSDGPMHGLNLRDLGGIAAGPGGSIKSRLVYRSAAPVELTGEQQAVFVGMGLTAIVDLRYDSERAARPVAWQDLGARIYRMQANEPAGGADFAALLVDEAFDSAAAAAMMEGVYRRLPFDHVPSLKDVFGQLLAGEGPTLIHCTSGKDRTGMASALLLTALEVHPEAIIEDYLASLKFDVYRSPSFRSIPEHRREALYPIFSVHADYLAAMLDEIRQRAGSVDHFLAAALGVGRAERDRLAALLVE